MQAELQTLHASIPVAANARKRWTSRASVRLLLSDGEGGIGIGEAAPLAGLSTETAAEAREALAHFKWPKRAPSSLAGVAKVVAKVDPALPSVRFAVETALLSLWTSRLGMPLWSVWAESVDEVPLAMTLWGADDRQLVDAAKEAAAFDAPAVKVKIGRNPTLDEWLIETVRSLLPDAELRLDANGALDAKGLSARLDALSAYRPGFLEEPASLDVIEALDSVPFPMAVDESLAGPDGDAMFERALACRHVDVVVLKPSLLGGLTRCETFARRAREVGKRAVVSHLMEGPIARAACAHLALALGREAAGLGDHPRAAGALGWPLHAVDHVDEGIEPPEHAGLGLDLRY